MKSKNIVFTQANKAELITEELKPLGAKDVLVKLDFSTISSGTERANLTGSNTVAWNLGPTEAVFPRRSGYSSTGTVVEIGSEVTKHKVGDKVSLSWSNHQEYNVISEKYAYPLEGVDPQEGALFHIATFPMAAIRKCRTEIGDSAIVMGMGVLGLVAIMLLRAAGAAPIIAVDPVKEKREQAIKYGADYAFDPYDKDFSANVKEVTKGGCRVGIEVTGIGAGLDGILDCMARFGRVALLGCTRSSDFTIDYYRKVHGPGITLIGAHTNARPVEDSSGGWWTQEDDVTAVRTLTKLGRLNLLSLVEEVHSPNEAPEIYTRLATDKTFPVVQFDWRKLK